MVNLKILLLGYDTVFSGVSGSTFRINLLHPSLWVMMVEQTVSSRAMEVADFL
jgi:hypothetical protein